MRGQLPGPACNIHRRFGKRRDRYGNLLQFLAADSSWLTEPMKASPQLRRGDREGLGLWLEPRLLQAFGSRADCWEGERCHKSH
jgi:hypothetical protein